MAAGVPTLYYFDRFGPSRTWELRLRHILGFPRDRIIFLTLCIKIKNWLTCDISLKAPPRLVLHSNLISSFWKPIIALGLYLLRCLIFESTWIELYLLRLVQPHRFLLNSCRLILCRSSLPSQIGLPLQLLDFKYPLSYRFLWGIILEVQIDALAIVPDRYGFFGVTLLFQFDLNLLESFYRLCLFSVQ